MATVIIQRTRNGRSVMITPNKVMIDGKEVFGTEANAQRQKATRMAASGLEAAVAATAGIVNIGNVVGRQVIVTQRAGTIVNVDGDVTIEGSQVTVTNRKKR